MRSQCMLAPHPRHHNVAGAQLGCELAGTPVGRAVAGLALYAPLQNARLQHWRERGWQLPGVAAEQPGPALSGKSHTLA